MQKLRLVHDGGPILKPQNMKEMAKILVDKFLHKLSTQIKLVGPEEKLEMKKVRIIQEDLREDVISRWIDSCVTEEQVESCKQFLERAIERKHLAPETFSFLHKSAQRKLREVIKQKIEQKKLPYLIKRQAALEEMYCSKRCGHKMKDHVFMEDKIICPPTPVKE